MIGGAHSLGTLDILAATKLLIIVNVDWFFLSHRLVIAQAALRAGYDVHVACGLTGSGGEIEKHGLILHELPLRRGGTAPLAELATFRAIISVLRTVRPDIVHLVSIKPVLFGGLASRFVGPSRVVAAISGMGFVFTARGAFARLRKMLISILYRAALGASKTVVIVQNPDDAALVRRMADVPPEQLVFIRGSGVDLTAYVPSQPPTGETVLVFAARLLVDKGIREFIAAAELLKKRGVAARFVVAGNRDAENPGTIGADELERWRREGVVEFLGHHPDIPALFAQAHVIVLPSYREGLPKVLLEAGACARAVITTDVPGCRDAVEPGRSALLVPPMSVAALADAMGKLIEDRDRCIEMGWAGRALAEREFGLEKVIAAHLDIYRGLFDPAPQAAGKLRAQAQADFEMDPPHG